MRRSGYVPADSSFPFVGLNLLTPSTMGNPQSVVRSDNVVFTKGHVSTRPGLTTKGMSGLSGFGLLKAPKLFSFGAYLYLVGDSKLYEGYTTTWTERTPYYQKQDITGTVTGTVVAGNLLRQDVTNATGTVISVAGSGPHTVTIMLTYGVFSGDNDIQNLSDTGSIESVTAYSALSTSTTVVVVDSDRPEFTVVSGTEGEFIVMCGRSLTPVVQGARTATFTPFCTNLAFQGLTTTSLNWETMAQFANHFLVALEHTAGTTYGYTIYWSTAYSVFDFATGTSGIMQIPSTTGIIKRLVPFRDRLAVYTENGIGLITYVGDPQIFVYEQVVVGTNLLLPQAVVPLGPYHLIVFEKSVMLFDGSPILKNIGEAIELELRTVTQSVANGHACADLTRNRAYISPDGTFYYVLEWDQLDFATYRWTKYTFDEDISISDLVYHASLDNVTGMTLSNGTNYVAAYLELDLSYSQTADLGSFVITSILDTIDFTVPVEYQSELGRWNKVEVEMKGAGDITLQYSLDLGVTFTTIDTITLTSTWTRYVGLFDTVSRTIRFRISAASTTAKFEIRWLRGWFLAVGSR